MRKIWLMLLLFLQATLIAYGVEVSKAVGSIPVWRLTAENNLGSVTHIVSPAGTKVAETAYDAWGRTRSTTNWSLYEYTDPQTLLYRGYAGYPALQTLGLYHASARIYDPLTGRFLGYDPVVQDPNNSQNWNSYAYCLNNPFRYTDPDGRFIGTALTAVSQFFVAFARGIVEPYFVAFSDTAKAGRMFEEAWTDYGHKVSNAFGIDMGLFVTDSNLSFAERISSVISRFTWELPQTIIGNGISHFRNCTSDISVDYYNGATLVNADNNGSRWGIAFGSYINGQNIRGTTDPMFYHEFGHTFQSRQLGLFYIPYVGIPSFIGCILQDIGLNDHNQEWWETHANILSYNYLSIWESSQLEESPWDEFKYPLQYSYRHWYSYLVTCCSNPLMFFYYALTSNYF